MELGVWKRLRLDMVQLYANPADEHKVKSAESIHFIKLFATRDTRKIRSYRIASNH